MKDKQQVIDFLTHLKGESYMQICTLNEVIRFSEVEWRDWIYFCWWLWSQMKDRCEDANITTKKYVWIDIDIRNDYFKRTWEVISQEDLRAEIVGIIALLQLKWYGDYCAIVDSWNWVHIYWTWKERAFEATTYFNWVKKLHKIINYIIEETWFACDPACCNLARIMRLPWTINLRKKDTKRVQFDLWPTEVEILYFEPKDSQCFDELEDMAEMYKAELEEEKKQKVELKREVRWTYVKWDDIWAEINSVPIGEIAEFVWWVSIGEDDWEIVTLRERNKNMWAYVYKPYNVIYNQWSSLVKTNRKTFTPFELVCFEMFDGNQWNAVKWFEEKYGIKTSQDVVIEKRQYEKQWFLFPDAIFDWPFDCVMSWELVTVVAESNAGKTTFAMDMIDRNVQRWKRCLYINLEFGIEQVAVNNWLFMNWKRKSSLTDINPLTVEERRAMDEYVQQYLWRFDHVSNPWWIEPKDLYELLVSKADEWYQFVVIDTFSMIKWNSDEWSRVNQNKCMENLQRICQNTWLCILQLHHTNKKGEMDWSKKILNLSNTLVTIARKIDDIVDVEYSEHVLTKDKFTQKTTVNSIWEDRKRKIYDL